MPIHFPEKVKMANTLIEDVKYFMPTLDLTRTKNGKNKGNQNNSNANNNNSHNTKANTEDITLNKKRNFETEEWVSVMKTVGLAEDEMERFFKNKFMSKLIEAIDMLIGIVIEKTNLIAQVQYDKAILNNQIAVYKKDNVTLTQNYLEIKDKLKAFDDKNHKKAREGFDKKDKDQEENNELDSSLVILLEFLVFLKLIKNDK